MSSIMTNSAAMTALKSLQATNNALESTQARISTGYKVGEASDNAAYWSIATTMRSDNKALSTVQDALGLGSAKVDVAYTGMNAAIDVVDEIKSKLVAASEPGVDKSKIQSEVSQLQKQLVSIADSSSFSGENWLSVDTSVTGFSANKDIVASFNRDSNGDVSVGTVRIVTTDIHLFDANTTDKTEPATAGLLDLTNITVNAVADSVSITTLKVDEPTLQAGELDGMITAVDEAIQSMTTAAANLGSNKSRITMQTEFVSSLMDSIDRGVGTLVDADMTKESTRLSALQTQQQLGTQALSIANSSAQSILSLFR